MTTAASIGEVSSSSPAWTDALSVPCARHSADRGVPCWSLPGSTTRRSSQAVCAWRVSLATSLHAAQEAHPANVARERNRQAKAAAANRRGRS